MGLIFVYCTMIYESLFWTKLFTNSKADLFMSRKWRNVSGAGDLSEGRWRR